jgi:hypothetical protein
MRRANKRSGRKRGGADLGWDGKRRWSEENMHHREKCRDKKGEGEKKRMEST